MASSLSFSPSSMPATAPFSFSCAAACRTLSICTSSRRASSVKRAARRVRSDAWLSRYSRETRSESCSYGSWIFVCRRSIEERSESRDWRMGERWEESESEVWRWESRRGCEVVIYPAQLA